MEFDFRRELHTDLREVFVPGSRVTARWVLAMVRMLPDDSATVGAMRAAALSSAATDDAGNVVETPEIARFRKFRQARAWTLHAELLARIGDHLSGKPYPRPGHDGADVSDRLEVDLDDIGQLGF